MCREGSCWGEGFPLELCPSLPIVGVGRHQMTFSVNLEKNRGAVVNHHLPLRKCTASQYN